MFPQIVADAGRQPCKSWSRAFGAILILRQLPSWQRPGVVSQQRLRLRRLTLVKRIPNWRTLSHYFRIMVIIRFFLSNPYEKYTYKSNEKRIFSRKFGKEHQNHKGNDTF